MATITSLPHHRDLVDKFSQMFSTIQGVPLYTETSDSMLVETLTCDTTTAIVLPVVAAEKHSRR